MYLLLRNNKQSGPYSLEELKGMGLKAYDLVWLEGKSAAWRYPSELEELSAFAPAVEEQPFDRFYKKPAGARTVAEPVSPATEATVSAPSPVTISPVIPATTPAPAIPLYTGEPSAVPGKRIIYVTMPAGKTPAPMRDTPRDTPVLRESPAFHETPKEPVRQTTVTGPGNPNPAHLAYASGPGYINPIAEDYSSQLPSLEEQLEAVSPRSHRGLNERRRGKQINVRLLRPLAIGACILALLAAGIFIGVSISRTGATSVDSGQKIASKGQDAATRPDASKSFENNTVHPISQQLPASPTNPAGMTALTEKPKDPVPTIASQPALIPPATKTLHGTSKERPASTKKGILPSVTRKDSAAVPNPVAGRREAVHRADLVERRPEEAKSDGRTTGKEPARPSISDQVSVGANGYSVGTFGGINDLQLTVTNRSVYPLDMVVVEVQYIQANKKVYKTENLYFRNIGAGSALMQEAPKSSRGIKVQYKITTISSKDLGSSYSGL